MNQIPLATIVQLLSKWEEYNVDYCHWKSNQHLPEALSGETDLDILVDENKSEQCEILLSKLGFQKVISPPWAQYPYIHDWIGFDEQTGRACHVHLHYRLIIGEKYIKNLHLPLENWLLSTTRIQSSVRVPQYEKELILLIIRSVLKTSVVSLLKGILKPSNIFPKNIREELNWLIDNSDLDNIPRLVQEMDLSIQPNFFKHYLNKYTKNEISSAYIWHAKKELQSKLKKYKTTSAWKRKITYIPYTKVLNLFRKKRKKHLPHDGLYIAIVGCDGSGKTTLSLDLKRWLGWKIQTVHTYFGIPKTFPARPIHITYKLGFAGLRKVLPITTSLVVTTENWIDAVWWLYIARKRKRIHKRNIRLKKKGYIIIAERFPLREFWSMAHPMDGPRIKKSRNRLMNILHEKERSIYRSISLPDRLFILQASIEELRLRKPNTNKELQDAKAKAVNTLKSQHKYSFINAEQPYEKVLLEIKRLTWKEL